MKEQRTLCHSCVQDYEEAGYCVKPDYSTQYKDRCDICGRMGWVYWIEITPKVRRYGKRVCKTIL